MGGNGGMTCTVCRSEANNAVDEALVAGEPLRDIAGRTGLSKSSLDRHKQDHLSGTLVKAAEGREIARGQSLLDRVNGLVDKALGVLKDAEESKDGRLALGAVKEARSCLELVGRVSGELKEGNRDNTPMAPVNFIMILGKMFSRDELNRMIAGTSTSEENERYREAYLLNTETVLLAAPGQTVEGKSHIVGGK